MRAETIRHFGTITVATLLFVACGKNSGRHSIGGKHVGTVRGNNLAMMSTKERQMEPLLGRIPAVQAICLGERDSNFIFEVYIDRNLPVPELPPGLVPRIVIPVGPIVPLSVPPSMGMSTSNMASCDAAGSLGMAVKDRRSPFAVGYITSNHVAAATEVRLCPNGDPARPKVRKQVAPGTGDAPNCQPDQIGNLNRSVPIDPSSTTPNTVDAAFVENSNIGTEVSNGCSICPSDLSRIPADVNLLNTRVRKCGKVTSFTCGTVDGIHCTVWVRYRSCGPAIKFVEQIRVRGPFAQMGDSGSVAYGEKRGIVGLLFVGDGQTTTFLNPMDDVLRLLDVDVVPIPPCASDAVCQN
jgi:hypothetical protein